MYLTNDERCAQDPDLQALLATHAATLQPLLGPLWPVHACCIEQFGPLTKYTLGEMPDGRWAMLHCLREPDTGLPHSHPCRMDSFGIAGSYWEERYVPLPEGGYRVERVLRAAGGYHTIEATGIHRVVELPDGPCWTLVLAGPVVNQWRHYSADELGAHQHSHFR